MKIPVKDTKGITLVEVLLTVVILAGVLTVIIQSLMTGLKATLISGRYNEAVFFAENTMFALLTGDDLRQSPEGSLEEPFGDFEYDVEEEADLSLLRGAQDPLERLRLEIRWPSGTGFRKINISTHFIK